LDLLGSRMIHEANTANQVPLAFCPSCERTAITYRDLGAAGEIVVRCLSCDGDLGTEGEVEELLGGAALFEALGYEIAEARPRGGAGGCRTGGGGGCSGCSTKGASPKKHFQA
jgi:hypothetical protein